MLSAILPAPVLSALSLPLLFLLTAGLGWALAGPLRRTPVHSRPERWLIYALLGITAISWVGVILAALDLFRPWIVVGALAALIGLAAWRHRGVVGGDRRPATGDRGARAGLRLKPQADIPNLLKQVVEMSQSALERTWSYQTPNSFGGVLAARLPVVVVIVVLALAGWLYARPAETFFLTDDAAVYTISGVVLARTGSLFFRPDTFWTTTEPFVRQFFGADIFLQAPRHFGPFFQWSISQPALEIGFLPLPKVWTALAVWLFGAARATWAAPFFGVMGLAALYGLARRLLNRRAALAAMIVLAVSLPQFWFARYPLSEIYTQVLLLGGLYLLALARQAAGDLPRARSLTGWSALCLAALTVTRFEGVLMLAVLAALWLLAGGWQAANGLARRWSVVLAGAGGLGLAISAGVARHYFFSQTLISLSPGIVRAGLAAALVGGVAGMWAWRTQRTRLAHIVQSGWRWLPLAIAALWVGWAALAGWQLLSGGWATSLPGWLAQYWTRPALALGVLGIVWLACSPHPPRERGAWGVRSELLALFGLAGLLLLGYTASPGVNPVQPWAMRRLVPAILPALALGIGALLGYLPVRLPLRSRPARLSLALLTAVLVATLAFGIGQRAWPMVDHREQAGVYDQAQAIAERLPPNAVLLFDNGEIGERLTQVFELVFGRVALAIRQDPPAGVESEVDRLVVAAHAHGRPVYLIITDGDLAWRPERWQLASRGAGVIQTTMLKPVAGRPPSAADAVTRTLPLDFYEILPAQRISTTLPFAAPVGAGSYPYVGAGFWPWTTDDRGQPFRWTNGAGELTLPWPAPDPAQPASACLVLQVAGGRPENAPQVQLTVEAEGVRLYGGQLPPGYGPQLLKLPLRDLPNRAGTVLEVRLTSDTWTPDGVGPLGVLVRGLQIQEADDCAR